MNQENEDGPNVKIKQKKSIKLTIKPSLFYKFSRQSNLLKSHRPSSKELLRRFKHSGSKKSLPRGDSVESYERGISPTMSNNYYTNFEKPKLKLRLSQDYKSKYGKQRMLTFDKSNPNLPAANISGEATASYVP